MERYAADFLYFFILALPATKSAKLSSCAIYLTILIVLFFINYASFFAVAETRMLKKALLCRTPSPLTIYTSSNYTKNESEIFDFIKNKQHVPILIDLVENAGQLKIICQGRLYLSHRSSVHLDEKNQYKNESGVVTVSFKKGIHKIYCCSDAESAVCNYEKEDACCPDCCPDFYDWLENANSCFKPPNLQCTSLSFNVYNGSADATDNFDGEYFDDDSSYNQIDGFMGHRFNIPCRSLQNRFNERYKNLRFAKDKNTLFWNVLSSSPPVNESANGICVQNLTKEFSFNHIIACSEADANNKQYFNLKVYENFNFEWKLQLNINGRSIVTDDEIQLRLSTPTWINITCSYRCATTLLFSKAHTVICLRINVIQGESISQQIWCDKIDLSLQSGAFAFTRHLLLRTNSTQNAKVTCSAWTHYEKPKLLKWLVHFFDLNQTFININQVKLIYNVSHEMYEALFNNSTMSTSTNPSLNAVVYNFFVPYDNQLDVIISYNSTPNNVPLNLTTLGKNGIKSRLLTLENDVANPRILFQMNTFSWHNSSLKYSFIIKVSLANVSLILSLNFHCYWIKMKESESNFSLINVNSIVNRTISREFQGCGTFEFTVVLGYRGDKNFSDGLEVKQFIRKFNATLTKLPRQIEIVSISQIIHSWNNYRKLNLTYAQMNLTWISKNSNKKQNEILIEKFQLTDLPLKDLEKVHLFYYSSPFMNWLPFNKRTSIFVQNHLEILCACVNCTELKNSSANIKINNENAYFVRRSQSIYSLSLWTIVNTTFMDFLIASSGKSNSLKDNFRFLNITCGGSLFETDILWNFNQTPQCHRAHESSLLDCESWARPGPHLAIAKMNTDNKKMRLVRISNLDMCTLDTNKISYCKISYNINASKDEMNGRYICLSLPYNLTVNEDFITKDLPSGSSNCSYYFHEKENNFWKHNISLTFVVVSAIFSLIIFSICFTIIYKKWAISHQRHLRLKNNWLYLSKYLAVEGVDFDCDDTMRMRFDEGRWGLSSSQIKVGSQLLGSGAFGEVRVGQYTPCAGGQPVLVAVKQPRDEFSDEHQRCLAEELKILGYIGQHEYIVSLIGAVIDKRIYKLQVVVEYCAHGNLQNFLKGKQLIAGRSRLSQYKRITNYPNLLISGVSSSVANGSIFYQSDQEQTQLLKWTTGSNKTSIGSLRHFELSNSTYGAGVSSRNDNVIAKDELYNFAFHVANGMNYLAGRRVIHRDLAARNVLLADSPNKDGQLIAKICDFGLAKNRFDYANLGDSEVGADYISSAIGCCNMPWRWLAPECFREMHYSTASDVWSYGVLLWEIFSLGRVPWEQYTNNPGVYKNMLANIEAGGRLQQPAYASRSVHELMLECWDKEPVRRPKFVRIEERLLALIESLDYCGELAPGSMESSGGSFSGSCNGRTFSTSTTSSIIPEASSYITMTSPLKEEDEESLDVNHTNKIAQLVIEELESSESKTTSAYYGSIILDPLETHL